MARKRRSVGEAVSEIQASRRKAESKPEEPMYFPTGSTLLNLALTDRADGGWVAGKIANVIGDSSSGKTFLLLQSLAEIAHDPRFKDYRLIYDDAEEANEFDVGRLFGQALVDRLEAPAYQDDEPVFSETIQDFEHNVHGALDGDRPFVYVLDSFDSLSSEEEHDKLAEQRKARAKGNKTAGSYGMEKAKKASQMLRMIRSKLKRTKSIVIIISQTRDNIGIGFAEKTRSGGKALKFYSTHEMWLAVKETMKRTVKGQQYAIGIQSRVKVSKNKITGKVRSIPIAMYYDYGVDDMKTNIAFLLKHKVWVKRAQTIDAGEFGTGTEDVLVAMIEEDRKKVVALQLLVAQTWKEIEDALNTKRSRYDD